MMATVFFCSPHGIESFPQDQSKGELLLRGRMGCYEGFKVYETTKVPTQPMKDGNQKQPAGGKFEGQFEDRAFRKRADKRHRKNKLARKARRANRR